MKAFLILLAVIFSGAWAAADSTLRPTVTPLEQEILEQAIAQLFPSGGVVLEQRTCLHTENETRAAFLKRLQTDVEQNLAEREHPLIPGLDTSAPKSTSKPDRTLRNALADFIRKNQSAASLVFPRPLPTSIQLASTMKLNWIFFHPNEHSENLNWWFPFDFKQHPTGWDCFYLVYPEALRLVTVSHLGVDSQHQVAILYVEYHEEEMEGGGGIYLLRFVGKKWVIQDEESMEYFGSEWTI
ncbi:MAG: hypothetical protein QM796_08935 [Chthoniobacteraceae bacterium]